MQYQYSTCFLIITPLYFGDILRISKELIILRKHFCEQINKGFQVHPIIAILGPRQVGKTTIASQYISSLKTRITRQHYFDLENTEDLIRLEQPQLVLQQLGDGLIVIDEIQRKPELFPILRVLVDNQERKQKFLILGSASGELLRQSSESLAGRIQYLELTPFSITEIEPRGINEIWLRGGFPRSYLANTIEESHIWRNAFIRTFLEQDLPNLGLRIQPLNLRRFWLLLANYHGNICNLSEIGRNLGFSDKTIRHYLDILSATFMIRQLPPWFANINKQQVKRPKIFFRDSGIFHTLLNIKDLNTLYTTNKIGASWEGFILEELIRYHNALSEECFFWSTQSRAELDLLIVQGNNKHAFEIKYTEKPKLTKSMQIALEDLQLDKITYIYPGNMSYPLSEQVFVTNIVDFFKDRNI